MDAIENRPSAALRTRLAERKRERDETLARVAALEAKHKRHEDIPFAPGTLDFLIEELRRGLEADHAMVRDTFQRIVAKVEVKKDGGTLYICVPPTVLSVHTPGALQTTGPLSALLLGL